LFQVRLQVRFQVGEVSGGVGEISGVEVSGEVSFEVFRRNTVKLS